VYDNYILKGENGVFGCIWWTVISIDCAVDTMVSIWQGCLTAAVLQAIIV